MIRLRIMAISCAIVALPAGDTPESTLVEFTTPFTVGGDSFLFLQSGTMGEESHSLAPSFTLPAGDTLSGGGTPTVTFERHYDESLQNYLYTFAGLRFDFAKDKPSDVPGGRR